MLLGKPSRSAPSAHTLGGLPWGPFPTPFPGRQVCWLGLLDQGASCAPVRSGTRYPALRAIIPVRPPSTTTYTISTCHVPASPSHLWRCMGAGDGREGAGPLAGVRRHNGRLYPGCGHSDTGDHVTVRS